MLDSLCPPESSNVRRHLCTILVTDDREEDGKGREQLRQFTRQFEFSRDRIAFSYVFREKQTEFLRALLEGFNKWLLRFFSIIKSRIFLTQMGNLLILRQLLKASYCLWRQYIRRLSYIVGFRNLILFPG
jgi:hypothetical protein